MRLMFDPVPSIPLDALHLLLTRGAGEYTGGAYTVGAAHTEDAMPQSSPQPSSSSSSSLAVGAQTVRVQDLIGQYVVVRILQADHTLKGVCIYMILVFVKIYYVLLLLYKKSTMYSICITTAPIVYALLYGVFVTTFVYAISQDRKTHIL